MSMDRILLIEDLIRALESSEYFDGYLSNKRIDIEKELSQQLELLNQETDWVAEVGSTEDFIDSIATLENDFYLQDGADKKMVLKIMLDKLKRQSKDIFEKLGLWEYCNQENYELAIDLQSQKLDYLLESFRMIGIYCEGVDNIQDLVYKEYQLIELRNANDAITYLTEVEKRSYKLKLAILYRLGIIDHLQKFDSLKNNDSAMSRVLASFMGGNKDSYQPYLSAAKNNPMSSSSQNNPLSAKLIEEVEDILARLGINLDELEG
jgi:hypothetical protein